MKKLDRTKQSKLFKALKRAGKMDFRVGQILEVVKHDRYKRFAGPNNLFYIENDDLADLINEYLKKTTT